MNVIWNWGFSFLPAASRFGENTAKSNLIAQEFKTHGREVSLSS
jgi:hypothetical protein